GGEKVLEAIGEVFPEADIFTLLWIKGSVSEKIEQHAIITSYLQHFPLVEKKYRYYLPIMPHAIQSMDLSKYDMIISSSHCVAKGIRKRKDAKHICYCHTPMRYIWDQYDEYFNKERAGFASRTFMKVVRPYLQRWDVQSSESVDVFVANSRNVRDRIRRIYGKDAVVIYPPINTDYFKKAVPECAENSAFYLMVTALVPYKRVDIAVRAFNELGYPLKIVGSGPEASRLMQM
ncbi:MAG: glycosyltransferase, partial [Endomicrobiales bacterium]